MEDSPTHEAMRKASISRNMEIIEGAKKTKFTNEVKIKKTFNETNDKIS